VWARAETATEADALSTAFMVMAEEEIREYCLKHKSVSGMLALEQDDDVRISSFGSWPY
jgi:thiamine biosynthesis lipoprotein ApbE